MQFLTCIIGGSVNMFLIAELDLGFVLVLIVLALWGLKLVMRASNNVVRAGTKKRLAVVDTLPVDGKRQLIIIRRDNVEHLILTGGPQDLVVEAGFVAETPVSARPTPPARRAPLPQAPQRAPVPQRPAAPEPATPVASNDEAPAVSPLERLRDLGRTTGPRRSPSLRHTGLLRPVSRMEPGLIPSNPDNSAPHDPDSATTGRVMPFGAPRDGNGQAFGDDDNPGGQARRRLLGAPAPLCFRARYLLGFAVLLGFALIPNLASAQDISVNFGDNSTLTQRAVQLVGLLTVLSLAPSILVMVTSFTRIIVVLSLLRTAIGLQTAPPNAVMVSLALFLTAFIMAPTLQQSYDQGIAPLMAGTIQINEAFDKTAAPLHKFMMANVREDDLKLFYDLSGKPAPDDATTIPLQLLVPAFMISELRRAFEIGFLLFLPFVVIDMVVASVLMSMGMMMLPPVVISLPFKLIFFVLVDGWHLVAGSLVRSFVSG